MKRIDSNVLVRYLVEDEPGQTNRVERRANSSCVDPRPCGLSADSKLHSVAGSKISSQTPISGYF